MTESIVSAGAGRQHAHEDKLARSQRLLDLMRNGEMDEFTAMVHPRGINLESKVEPLACRTPGPEGFHATAMLLRAAFTELVWVANTVVEDGEYLVVHATMSGRHTGTLHDYDAAGQITGTFPPTGRSFSTTQTHWFRFRDGQVLEHWANRDDLQTALQLGWLPPKPGYIVRMLLAQRRARRAQMRGREPGIEM